jgi:hypothetical protein
MTRSSLSLIGAIILLAGIAIARDEHLLGLEKEEADAIHGIYARARSLLGPKERHILEEIVDADDVLLERQARGIVDQILSAISGVTNNAVVGSRPAASTPQQQQQVQPQPAPVTSILQPTTAPIYVPINATQQQGTTQGQLVSGAMDGNNNHLFSQVSKVVGNSVTGNVTGIVDEALKIGTPAPVRDLVNGILGVAYCNGIRRLLGRC